MILMLARASDRCDECKARAMGRILDSKGDVRHVCDVHERDTRAGIAP